jgi:hypothetical protein
MKQSEKDDAQERSDVKGQVVFSEIDTVARIGAVAVSVPAVDYASRASCSSSLSSMSQTKSQHRHTRRERGHENFGSKRSSHVLLLASALLAVVCAVEVTLVRDTRSTGRTLSLNDGASSAYA